MLSDRHHIVPDLSTSKIMQTRLENEKPMWDQTGMETEAQFSQEISLTEREDDSGVGEGTYTAEVDAMEDVNHGKLESGKVDILSFLKRNGIRVYIIDAEVCETIPDIIVSVKSIICHITMTSKMRPSLHQPRSAERCLLYKDMAGRFFNLTLPPYTTSPASMFQSYLDSFSGVQAMGILVVLCRSFPCALQADTIVEMFQPAFLAVLLGLVFIEEIGLSWLNTTMFVRGMPSISAYSITTNYETDWIRKLIIFCLYLAAVTTGDTRLVLTLGGISLTCLVILANLGARSWGFMDRRPLRFGGPLEPILAYSAAVILGAAVPYLAYRETKGGRRAAIEGTIKHALLVGIIFVASDYNDIQKFLVIGSENCDQFFVNIGVGAWWFCSFISSLIVIMRLPSVDILPGTDKPLLQEDHASPVGFKVPLLSDFPVDPILSRADDDGTFNLVCELIVGTLLALAGGGSMLFLAYSDSEYFA